MTEPSKTTSTMGNWVHAIVRCLDAQGIDGTEIALRAGVRPRAIRIPEIRVPQNAVTQLWHTAVEATGDPCFGLTVPRYITPNTFGAFAYSLFASSSLSAVFRRIIRYHAFVTSGAIPRFEIGTDRVRFTCIVDSSHEPADASIDAFFLMIVRMAKFLTGEWKVEPLAIYLRRAEPPGSERFHKAFRHRVEFGSARNRSRVQPCRCRPSVADADASVAQKNDQIMARQLEGIGRETLSPAYCMRCSGSYRNARMRPPSRVAHVSAKGTCIAYSARRAPAIGHFWTRHVRSSLAATFEKDDTRSRRLPIC